MAHELDEARDTDRFGPLRLVALAIASRRRLALLIGGHARWQRNAEYTFVPLELPGTVQEPGTRPDATADDLGQRVFGCQALLIASRQLYGPSAAHRIDRLPPSTDDDPLPLLRLERAAPLHIAASPRLRRVIVTVYRARLDGTPALPSSGTDGAAGLLWVSPDTLKLVMRGMPFAELLAQPAVEWLPCTAAEGAEQLPDNTLVYVPADFGERHLLRLVAKYGPEALFQSGDEGWNCDHDDGLRLS